MNCQYCGQDIPKEDIVDKVERRMKEYGEWIWKKVESLELPRLPWDVKNCAFFTYADRKK